MPPITSPELARIGDALYAYRAETSVFDASLTSRLPTRLSPSRFDEIAGDAQRAAGWLGQLRSMDAGSLSHADELTRRYLVYETDLLASSAELHWYDLQIRPYRLGKTLNQAHDMVRCQEFDGPADVDAYLGLLREYGKLFADNEFNLGEQTARGIVMHAEAIRTGLRLLEGVDGMLVKNLRIDPARLQRLSTADAARLQSDAERRIDDDIRPALGSLRAYMEGDYARRADDIPGVGIGRYAGGQEAYETLVRQSMTLDMTPDQVHRAGLDLVAQLEERMRVLRDRLGFSGDAAAFLQHLLANPPVATSTPEQIEATYLEVLRQSEAQYPALFGSRTYVPAGVRRLRPELEPGMTYGYYQPPIPNGDRNGYYVYNGSNPQDRISVVATALMLHETVPGHHLHFATQTMDERSAPVRRNPYLNGFAEAWAEYGAELGYEMGLYQDPHTEYGRLLMQMFLAVRLVVDTGLNAFGWSLEKARNYMIGRAPASPAEAWSETVRYTTWPAQSLAYALGPLHLKAARERATAALGSRFDIVGFHDAILDGGALPLPDVDYSVDCWVKSRL